MNRYMRLEAKLRRLKVGNVHADTHSGTRKDLRVCASICMQLLAIFYSRPPPLSPTTVTALITIYVNIFSASLLVVLFCFSLPMCVCARSWFLVEIFNYPPLMLTPVATTTSTTSATNTLATSKLLILMQKRESSGAFSAGRWLGA